MQNYTANCAALEHVQIFYWSRYRVEFALRGREGAKFIRTIDTALTAMSNYFNRDL